MKQGEWRGPSSEHEAVYHAASWCQAASLQTEKKCGCCDHVNSGLFVISWKESQCIMQDVREKYVNRMREECQNKLIHSKWRRNIDAGLQIVVIAGSASLPVLLNIAELSKLVPTVLSILVAVSAGLLKYFKFDEWGRIHRSTHLQLDNELEDYGLGTGQYKGLGKDEAFDLFRRMTALILSKHVKLVSDLHGQSQLTQQEDMHREAHAES